MTGDAGRRRTPGGGRFFACRIYSWRHPATVCRFWWSVSDGPRSAARSHGRPLLNIKLHITISNPARPVGTPRRAPDSAVEREIDRPLHVASPPPRSAPVFVPVTQAGSAGWLGRPQNCGQTSLFTSYTGYLMYLFYSTSGENPRTATARPMAASESDRPWQVSLRSRRRRSTWAPAGPTRVGGHATRRGGP